MQFRKKVKVWFMFEFASDKAEGNGRTEVYQFETLSVNDRDIEEESFKYSVVLCF